MRRFVSIGAALAAGVLAATVVAAPGPKLQSEHAAEKDAASTVDVELIIAVDVSYSMDLDELAIQREGYAQAIVSKEFLQALKSFRTARSRSLISSGRHPVTRRSSSPGA